MRRRGRHSWMLLSIGLVISIFLVFLWLRSLQVEDSALFAFSYKSHLAFQSGNGSITFAVAWNMPSPVALKSGIESESLDRSMTGLSPLGRFEFRIYHDQGLRLIVPHWLVLILTMTVFAGMLITRKFSFETTREAS